MQETKEVSRTWRIITTAKKIVIAGRHATGATPATAESVMAARTSATRDGKARASERADMAPAGQMITDGVTARDITPAMTREKDSPADAISAAGLIDHRTIAIGLKRRHQNADTTENMAGAMVRRVSVIVRCASPNGSIRERSD